MLEKILIPDFSKEYFIIYVPTGTTLLYDIVYLIMYIILSYDKY